MLLQAIILAHFTVESPWETISPTLTKSPPPFEKKSPEFCLSVIISVNWICILHTVCKLALLVDFLRKHFWKEWNLWRFIVGSSWRIWPENWVNANAAKDSWSVHTVYVGKVYAQMKKQWIPVREQYQETLLWEK